MYIYILYYTIYCTHTHGRDLVLLRGLSDSACVYIYTLLHTVYCGWACPFKFSRACSSLRIFIFLQSDGAVLMVNFIFPLSKLLCVYVYFPLFLYMYVYTQTGGDYYRAVCIV